MMRPCFHPCGCGFDLRQTAVNKIRTSRKIRNGDSPSTSSFVQLLLAEQHYIEDCSLPFKTVKHLFTTYHQLNSTNVLSYQHGNYCTQFIYIFFGLLNDYAMSKDELHIKSQNYWKKLIRTIFIKDNGFAIRCQ